jgi:nucleotide-binding universal stress UspA family protein
MPEVHAFHSVPTKILLPTDFSSSSEAALETAVDLAGHFKAELYLVNVMPFFPSSTYPDFVPEQSFIQEARTQTQTRLENCIKLLTDRGVKARFSVEVGNDVARNILEVIDREKIDLLVISTHGISGWHPLVFGSIAEKLIRVVQCPLLLLRSKKVKVGDLPPARRSMEWW